jgi:NAD(P)-dependent dehydrogenase (short-subunit alcohol dehydrogenase family)
LIRSGQNYQRPFEPPTSRYPRLANTPDSERIQMTTEIDLQQQVAVVTGGAGGIGESIARALAGAGARIALIDRDADRLAELADLGLPVSADLNDADDVDAAISRINEELGGLDILVNNAGIQSATPGSPFTNQSAEDWLRVYGVNTIGTFHAAKSATPFLLKSDHGAIVNVSSVSGRTGFQTDPAYGASKAAVLNFTQAMARDLAPSVRVNAVCPGMVFTPFYAAQHEAALAQGTTDAATAREYFDEKAGRLIPMARGQQPEDIASAVLFLASEMSASITGQALNVDGGLLMS